MTAEPSSGRLVIETDDQGWMGDWEFVVARSSEGWDLLSVDSVGFFDEHSQPTRFRFCFSARAPHRPEPWKYAINQEGAIDAAQQASALNTGVLAGYELVAVARCGAYIRYYCKTEPGNGHEPPSPWWTNLVVQRPITDVPTLLKSLSPERRDGWTYRDHLEAPMWFESSAGWMQKWVVLVYMQRLATELEKPEWMKSKEP